MPLNIPDANSDEFPVLPKGEYQFEVEEASESQRDKGTLMKLNVRVFYGEVKSSLKIYDYLMDYAFTHKLLHFMEAIGAQKCIDEKIPFRAEWSIGKAGICMVDIEDDEQYGKRNRIIDYKSPDKPARDRVRDKKEPKLEAVTNTQSRGSAADSVQPHIDEDHDEVPF